MAIHTKMETGKPATKPVENLPQGVFSSNTFTTMGSANKIKSRGRACKRPASQRQVGSTSRPIQKPA